MRRFKSFSVGVSENTKLLDSQVNAWLKKHGEVIEIVNTQVRTVPGRNARGGDYINITVVIWYDELEPVGAGHG